MARDPLRVLLTIRQREVDGSRLSLASSLRAEARAEAGIRAIDDVVRREREHAERFAKDPNGMEIFAAWLTRARAERLAAVTALAAAEAEAVEARAKLATARSAARTVQRTIEERATIARAEAKRRAQNELDDLTRGRGPERRQGSRSTP